MADGQVTIRTRKFLRNPLLQRRQFVVDVLHPNSAPASRADVQAELAKMYKTDAKLVFVFGFKVNFGGGSSTGFGLVYDNMQAVEQFEPRFRKLRNGMGETKKRSRKQWKDLKKKIRTTWGTGRRATLRKQKRAAA